MRIAWIGLGTMGAPMAGHLLAAGHEMHVHNRTREREELLAAAGASRAGSPAEAADGADLVFICVSDSPDLEAVVLGPMASPRACARGGARRLLDGRAGHVAPDRRRSCRRGAAARSMHRYRADPRARARGR